MLKLLILTTDKSLLKWKSLPSKLAFIKKALNSGENADFEVEVKYTDSTPLVTNGRVDHAWLEEHNRPYFSQGYDLIGFHMSRAQWKELGLIESLRGSNPRDNSEQEDFYFSSDEKNKRKGKDRFTQVCLHEAAHAYYQETGQSDLTHEWHERNPDISGLFKLMDWSLYQPYRLGLRYYLNLLERKFGLLSTIFSKSEPTRPLVLKKRLPSPFNEKVSQGYGVKNAIYSMTGRHIGVDYACPVGTPIFAPADGEITVSGEHSTLGKFCYFTYVWEGKTRVERNLHQSKLMPRGKYKAGDVIGYSGNTGMSTGPHYHVDGWWNEVNTAKINKTNWNELTYDPTI